MNGAQRTQASFFCLAFLVVDYLFQQAFCYHLKLSEVSLFVGGENVLPVVSLFEPEGTNHRQSEQWEEPQVGTQMP